MKTTIKSISAQNSVKRTRILYDVNAQSAFLPTTDPTILEASIARRKRRIQPKVERSQSEPSNALTIVTDDSNTMKPITPVTQSTSTSSSALVLADDHNSGSEKREKASGILVVRIDIVLLHYFFRQRTDNVSFPTPEINKIQIQSKNSYSRLARTLEAIYSFVITSWMG